MANSAETRSTRLRKWLQRIGLAGFLFFFLKGLVWIAIFIGIGKCTL